MGLYTIKPYQKQSRFFVPQFLLFKPLVLNQERRLAIPRSSCQMEHAISFKTTQMFRLKISEMEKNTNKFVELETPRIDIT